MSAWVNPPYKTSVFVCLGRERQWKEEGRTCHQKSQSVNYLSIQFGRWLPKNAEGSSARSSKGERGDTLLFKGLSESHLCLTKCLLPMAGLWATPGCPAYCLLITVIWLLSSLCFTPVPHLIPSSTSHRCPLTSHCFSLLGVFLSFQGILNKSVSLSAHYAAVHSSMLSLFLWSAAAICFCLL